MAVCYSSGSLTTDGAIGSTNNGGLLYGATAIGGVVTLYNGSTSGALLASVTSGYQEYSNPITFGSSGLHIQISAGSAVIHFS